MAGQYWWVNQTKTFKLERDLGLLWAPMSVKPRVSHWESLDRVAPRDVIFHYAKQRIQAVSRARSAASPSLRPYATDDWQDQGRRILVDIEPLDPPLRLDEIPLELRMAQRYLNSPFQQSGRVNQGYLFNLDQDAGASLLDLIERTEPTQETQQSTNVGSAPGQSAQSGAATPGVSQTAWTPPRTEPRILSASRSRGELAADAEQIVTYEEFQLQCDFAAWLESNFTPGTGLQLSTGRSTIRPDHYVKDREWIVEAKKSEARPYVRLAIGQVLDYVAVAEAAGLKATPVILLPRRPSPDLVALILGLRILLVVPVGDDRLDFEVV